jgi:predicted SnoaL-like aldol condensation-catalyzing enzyme
VLAGRRLFDVEDPAWRVDQKGIERRENGIGQHRGGSLSFGGFQHKQDMVKPGFRHTEQRQETNMGTPQQGASEIAARSNPQGHSATRKAQVVALLKSIETGEPGPASVVNPNKYIQHNLAVGDGLEGLGAVLSALPEGSAKVQTSRVFADGDYVFAHTEYNFFGPKIGFDIFRFEDDAIVEHWDNLQETPATVNPSGRSMIDGPVEVSDVDKTEANKALVKGFVEEVLVGGSMTRLASFFDGDNYHQHNPQIADGLSGLGAALKAMADAGVALKFDRLHRVLGEGNFVLAVSEGSLGGKPCAFYDLFRVQSGKIVEHWDTIEFIPPREDWKNNNGKF